MDLVRRNRLPHDIPLWIDPQKEVYFITINCRVRGINALAVPATANALLSSVAFREQKGQWFAYCFLVMPDHVHGLFMFPFSGQPIGDIVSDWKRWTARQIGIDWQSGFFEHRLRHDESASSKAQYILENPVRAGLVKSAGDWPYVRRCGSLLDIHR